MDRSQIIPFAQDLHCGSMREELSRTQKPLLHNDAEWNDIQGMLKVQSPDLNLALLQWWTKTLGITPLWQQALLDTGLRAA
jgi:hypothetical protein